MFLANVAFLQAGTITPDSSEVDYRTYDTEVIEDFKLQKEYNYDLDPKYEGNPIKRLWYKFVNRLLQNMGSGTRSALWNVIKYGLMGLCIFVMGRFLYRSSGTGVFKRVDKSPDYNHSLVKGESGGENLERIISQAETEEDFTKAVRYRFLLLLRLLDKEELIQWRQFKTNHEYATEIEDAILRKEFEKVSEVFEYVVYGDFDLDDQGYKQISQNFVSFSSLLKKASV